MSNSRAILAYLLSPSLLKLLLFVPIFLLIPNIGVAADDGVSLDKELGSCSALNRHVASGVVDAWGTKHPGAWGFTGIHFLINGLTGELFEEQLKDGKAPWKITVKENTGLGGTSVQSCATISNVDIAFVAQTDVSALEWLPKKKPPKVCWDQWMKKRNVIHSHEKGHAADYKKIASDETKKFQSEIKKMEQVPVCGPTSNEAMTAALQKIVKSIGAAHARMVNAVQDQTARHDHEAGLLSSMDCSKCEKGYSFSGVNMGCIYADKKGGAIKDDNLVSGYVCGDPNTDTWSIKTISTGAWRVDGGIQTHSQTYTSPVKCAPAGSQLERQYVEEARKKEFQYNRICIYKNDPTPQVTIRDFRQHAKGSQICEGPQEQAKTVAVQVNDQCDASQPIESDGQFMRIF